MADSAGPAEPYAVGDLEFLSDVYLDFDGVGGLDLFLDPPLAVDPPAALPDAAVDLVPYQEMDDIERFLMMDEGGGGVGEDERRFADDFFADALFAGSDEGSVRSAVSSGEAGTPEEGEGEGKEKSEGSVRSAVSGGEAATPEEGEGAGKEKSEGSVRSAVSTGDAATPEEGEGEEKEKSEGDVEPEGNAVAPVVESEKGTDGDESEGKGGEDEDLLSKKRRRQMRNRDSAMKSRERKKLYVKDLEVKSKILESECRRLQNALHCCVAENVSLRQCLQKAKALGAPLAKQESAVLFVESLLLGSLFWLVSIVCLLLMPSLPSENLEKASGVAKWSPRQIQRTKGLESERLGPGLGSEFIYKRRRCKALRRKMRIRLFLPLDMVFG